LPAPPQRPHPSRLVAPNTSIGRAVQSSLGRCTARRWHDRGQCREPSCPRTQGASDRILRQEGGLGLAPDGRPLRGHGRLPRDPSTGVLTRCSTTPCLRFQRPWVTISPPPRSMVTSQSEVRTGGSLVSTCGDCGRHDFWSSALAGRSAWLAHPHMPAIEIVSKFSLGRHRGLLRPRHRGDPRDQKAPPPPRLSEAIDPVVGADRLLRRQRSGRSLHRDESSQPSRESRWHRLGAPGSGPTMTSRSRLHDRAHAAAAQEPIASIADTIRNGRT